MSDSPDITISATPHLVAVKVRNQNGREWRVYRADDLDENYKSIGDQSAHGFVENVDPHTTYKYKGAFVENNEHGLISESRMRVRFPDAVDPTPATVAGANSIESLMDGIFDETFDDTFG